MMQSPLFKIWDKYGSLTVFEFISKGSNYYYKDEKGFELPEAVKSAIKRNGSILDEAMDEDSDDDPKDVDSQSELDDEDMEQTAK